MPNKDSSDSEEKEEKQDPNQKPLVSFGILSDIQYADVQDGFSYDKKRARYYRNSLNLVKEAVKYWKNYEKESNTQLKFILQLGDLIDGKCKAINDSVPAMRRVLAELNKTFSSNENDEQTTTTSLVDLNGQPRLLHIWGNHEMYNFKRADLVNYPLNTAKDLGQNLDSNSNFYSYNITEKLKIICLDFYEYSVLGYDESDDIYQHALKFLKAHNKNNDSNSVEGMRGHALRFSAFNGSLSDKQLKWLQDELNECRDSNKKAIICGHVPLHSQASDPMCLAWNNKQILEILWSYDLVIAYLAGHDHKGGYFRDKRNIHHLTFGAIIETSPNSNSFATVKVYENKISIEGVGMIGYYEIYFDN
jgi:manganese-dependent ADP-ribose/CDP-alcohol diphosphatase